MDTAAHRPVRRVARRPVLDDRPAPGITGGLPLTPGERRAWFLSQWAPGTAVDRSVALVRLGGPVDRDDLRARLAALVAAHPELRARYAETAGGPVRLPELAVETADLLTVSTESSVNGLTRAALCSSVDPVRGPLLRATLASGTRLLALTVHRLAADPPTTGTLLDELARPAAPPPYPEPDAALAAAGSGAAPVGPGGVSAAGMAAGVGADPADLAGEVGGLGGVEPVSLPVDTRAPAVRSWGTATVRRPLGKPLGADRLVAALAALLARYTGSTDIVLGTVLSGPDDRLANPVVLRVDASGDPTAAELLDRSRAALAAAHRARAVPFDRLVAALAPARDPAGHPLFRITAEVHDWRGRRAAEPVLPPEGAALTDLAIRVLLRPDGGAELVADYATELFDRNRIERMLDHLAEIARDAAVDPARRLGDLALLTTAERDRILLDWNDTATDYRADEHCLHELVREWAERTPDAPACRYAGSTLGYRELIGRADRLSARLRGLGVGPEELVAVVLDRGFDLPVALLGVLGAGAGYLPLDPTHPPERMAEQIADAGCQAIVVDERYADRLPTGPALVRPDGVLVSTGPARPEQTARPTPDNLAYVIFTSGSTGRPKGTMAAHRSVVNYVRHCRDLFGLGPGDRVLQFANPCFDVSVFDVFCTLGNGATLVHASRGALIDPRALTELLVAEQVTMADLPPAIPALLDPAELPQLRRLSLGGEAVPGELVRRWRTAERAVYNIYGPTEATVTCTDYACPLDGSAADPVIGGPISNLTAYVVDRYGQPVPVGVPGELLIGGIGVTRGYLGRPGLTAQRFVPDPFGPPGARVYRTGDLVRWRADGMLEFVGRVDRQVQLRGQRIEPGEVEAALRPHPDLESAVVRTCGGDLVAYLVAEPGRTAPDLGTVRAFLRDRLPGYLIPSAVVPLPALPLTSNGKVDLRALPDPRPAAAGPEPGLSGGAVQVALAGLWSRLLGVDQVRPDDDFFACGGDSLRAAELRQQVLRVFGVAIELPAFWAEPTLAALARTLRPAQPGGSNGSAGPDRSDGGGRLPG